MIDFEEYEDISAPSNLEEKVARVHPQLGCDYCPPHRGENATADGYKRMKRQPRQKQLAKRRDLSKLKDKQKYGENND